MGLIVITSGSGHTDIDAYACIIGLHELYSRQGLSTYPLIRAPLNHSVPPFVEKWGSAIHTQPPQETFESILVDVSEPQYILSLTEEQKVLIIYDHHFGFDSYWKARLGENAIIESVGACATLIWEEYVRHGVADSISVNTANLLYTAILSNTLNFKAQITTTRDHTAAAQLLTYCTLPNNWIERYFQLQEELLLVSPEQVIKNDTKMQYIKGLDFTMIISQLELWSSKEFVENNLVLINNVLSQYDNPLWFFTSPSISEGINHIYTQNDKIKYILNYTIGAIFNDNIGRTNKLWLRKEIIRELQKMIADSLPQQ